MSVRDRHADALSAEQGSVGGYNYAVFKMSPDFKRLLLAFFFLSADIRNNVVNHFGPYGKGFTGAGNGLIGGYACAFHTEAVEGVKRRNIALQRAV